MAAERQKDTALVTGASSGIGYELAQLFAKDGHALIIAAEDEPGLKRAAEALRMAGSPRVETIAVDLARADGAPKLYEGVSQLGLAPGFLVLNAGVGVWGDFMRETDLHEELKSREVRRPSGACGLAAGGRYASRTLGRARMFADKDRG